MEYGQRREWTTQSNIGWVTMWLTMNSFSSSRNAEWDIAKCIIQSALLKDTLRSPICLLIFPLRAKSKWEREREGETPSVTRATAQSDQFQSANKRSVHVCVKESPTWRGIWRCSEWRTGKHFESCSSCPDAVSPCWGSHLRTWWMTVDGQTHHTHIHMQQNMYACIHHGDTHNNAHSVVKLVVSEILHTELNTSKVVLLKWKDINVHFIFEFESLIMSKKYHYKFMRPVRAITAAYVSTHLHGTWNLCPGSLQNSYFSNRLLLIR